MNRGIIHTAWVTGVLALMTGGFGTAGERVESVDTFGSPLAIYEMSSSGDMSVVREVPPSRLDIGARVLDKRGQHVRVDNGGEKIWVHRLDVSLAGGVESSDSGVDPLPCSSIVGQSLASTTNASLGAGKKKCK